MTRERSMRAAVLDDPDDDAVRLVYADWLDEHGDTEADRALARSPHLGSLRQLELGRSEVGEAGCEPWPPAVPCPDSLTWSCGATASATPQRGRWPPRSRWRVCAT